MSTEATLTRSARPSPTMDAGRLAAAVQSAAATLFVIALWFLCRPYGGIRGDAMLYLGQALSTVSPATLGQDFMFAEDGQFGLSLFPRLAAALVAHFGVSGASMIFVVTGLSLWLAALAAVAAQLARGRALWAMLACTAAVPLAYSYWFRVGEPHATPRIFAEAAVLAALAVMLSGRRLWALPLLLVAALLHPVMALAGFGVLFLALCAHDRRWLWAGLALAALVLVAGALGAPMAERLFARMDAAWLEVVRARSKVVLPTTWPAREWGRMALQLATVAIAASLLTGPRRVVLGAIAVVAALGAFLTVLAGDWLGSLLVIQVQPWRAIWVAAAIAPACFVLCAFELRRGDDQARLTLAALALAWAGASSPVGVAAPAAALALLLRVSALRGRPLKTPHWLAPAIVVAAALMLAAFSFAEVRGTLALAASRPAEFPLRWNDIAPRQDGAVLLAGLLLVLAMLGPRRASARTAAVGLCAALTVSLAAALAWDVRSADQRALDRREGREALGAQLAASPGPVYWMGGVTHAWFWADRPSWFAMAQGAGVVFSRPLAMTWTGRLQALVAIGLEAPAGDNAKQSSLSDAVLSAHAARTVCALPGGPAWIVAPRQRATSDALSIADGAWTSPAAAFDYRIQEDEARWSATRDYLLFNCSRLRGGYDSRRIAALRPSAS